jgi:DNA-binding NtrC family response regulator
MINLLIVEDNYTLNRLLVRTLSEVYCVNSCFSLSEATEIIKNEHIDIVLSDIRLPDGSGLKLLDYLKGLNKKIWVIFMTGFGTVEEAVEAIKNGASDYILKPVEPEVIKAKVEIIKENIMLKKVVMADEEMIFVSKKMEDVVALSTRVAKTDSTVLITGETGTGKELLAKFIHKKSSRSDKIFLELNCANFLDSLFEAELFGYKKGAFTGAVQNKTGLAKVADGGTLFFDELAEIPLSFQGKLLKFIEEKRYIPVGSTQYEQINVRIISATNKEMTRLVQDGLFREDLFYRLNVITIYIPPLRERKEDIKILTSHFINKFKHINPLIIGIDEEALGMLVNYSFPGNVRELSNIIERAMIIEKENMLSADSLNICFHDITCPNDLNIENMIKNNIIKALKMAKDDRTKAAKLLGIDRSTLYRKLREYDL